MKSSGSRLIRWCTVYMYLYNGNIPFMLACTARVLKRLVNTVLCFKGQRNYVFVSCCQTFGGGGGGGITQIQTRHKYKHIRITYLDISVFQTKFTQFVTNLFLLKIKSGIPKTER